MNHNAEAFQIGGRWRAVCRCGIKSGLWATETLARADLARAHNGGAA